MGYSLVFVIGYWLIVKIEKGESAARWLSVIRYWLTVRMREGRENNDEP
jgi:hypothetical protein